MAALDLTPGKRSGRHTYSIEEVVLILRGTAEMMVGEEKAYLSAGEMVLVSALAPRELSNAGSDELHTVALFPNAAFVSVFDNALSPVESRVLITPPPEVDAQIPWSRPSRPTPDECEVNLVTTFFVPCWPTRL